MISYGGNKAARQDGQRKCWRPEQAGGSLGKAHQGRIFSLSGGGSGHHLISVNKTLSPLCCYWEVEALNQGTYERYRLQGSTV
jgi:hypothetical protein